MTEVKADSAETCGLLARIAVGDRQSLERLLEQYRPRWHAFIEARLGPRVRSRVDPSDVLQEAYLDLAQQLPAYLAKPEMPFFLWLRLLTGQRLMRLHRQHLGAAMRDAGREVSLYRGALPQASTTSLAVGERRLTERDPSS